MTTPSGGRDRGAVLRLLITGFFDWRELGSPPDLHRLRDNPSGRLLFGEIDPGGGPSPPAGGVLAALLDEAWQREVGVEAAFNVLPVAWGVAEGLAYDRHDVVIHMGLGVYDDDDILVVERGAYHRREGLDARERPPADAAFALGVGIDEVIRAPSWLDDGLDMLNGSRCEGYRLEVKEARFDNVFLCNETHGRALLSLGEGSGGGGLLAAYFIHLPYPRAGDERALADAVKTLIASLVGQVHARACQPSSLKA